MFKNPACLRIRRTGTRPYRSPKYSFGNALTDEESGALFDLWAIPASGRSLFEAAAANFSPHSPAKVDKDNTGRGPLLLVMGGQDHTVPESITKAS